MIYSTSDIARQAQPTLQGAVSQLHQASQRVRAGLKLDESQPAASTGAAARMSIGAAPGQNAEPVVKAMVKPDLSAQSAKDMASAAADALGKQFLSMANARPQTLSIV